MPDYIYVKREIVSGVNLAYWSVNLATFRGGLMDKPAIAQVLDAHWQHRAAVQCAERWSREFNLPIWGKSYGANN